MVMTVSARPVCRSLAIAGADGTNALQCGVGVSAQPSGQLVGVSVVPSDEQVCSVEPLPHTVELGVQPPLRSNVFMAMSSPMSPPPPPGPSSTTVALLWPPATMVAVVLPLPVSAPER